MEYKKCPKCGKENDKAFVACAHCGTDLSNVVIEEKDLSGQVTTSVKNANNAEIECKNTVAKILKGYAIANGIGGIILGLVLGEVIGWAIALAGIVASFFIYAFGEVIQLLEDIKNSSSKTYKAVGKESLDLSDELPDML